MTARCHELIAILGHVAGERPVDEPVRVIDSGLSNTAEVKPPARFVFSNVTHNFE